MLRSRSCIEGNIGYIIAIERSDALIHIVGTLIVAMEADIREVGLHQSWFYIGNTYLGMCHVDAQTIGDSLNGSLGSTIYIATRIGSITSHTTYINNVSVIALHHTRHYQASHGEQPLDIGIYHLVPIIKASFILRFQSTCQTCIIDEHIYVAPCLWDIIHSLLCRLTIAHIKSQSQDLDAIFCLQFLL